MSTSFTVAICGKCPAVSNIKDPHYGITGYCDKVASAVIFEEIHTDCPYLKGDHNSISRRTVAQ